MKLALFTQSEINPIHLLIIGDSEEKRQHLASSLSGRGVEIAGHSVPEALRDDQYFQPDLAVVDVEPKGLPDVLARLRVAEPFAQVPVLVAGKNLGQNPGLAGVRPQFCADAMRAG